MEDVTFSRGPARRPIARVSDALLQWSTGLTTTKRMIYAGWLVETGRNEAIDAAMQAAGFESITIKHGSGNLVTHWAVETANMFVIADGVQTIGEMKSTADRYGIAFGWRTLQDGRPQSVLKFRVLLRELLDVGFYEPIQVSVKSTLTGDLLDALLRQYDVLDTIDALRTQQGKAPLQPPFYACSIPLGPGQEVQRGATQKKGIVPPVALIPTPINRDYLVEHYVRKEWVPIIERLLDPTVAWSVATSAQISEEAVTPHEGEASYDPNAEFARNGQERYADSVL
jgi:hypothetical protein